MDLVMITVIFSYFVQTVNCEDELCARYFDNGDWTESIAEIHHGKSKTTSKKQISSIEVMEGCELTGYSDAEYTTKIVRVKSCSGTKQKSLSGTEDNAILSVKCVCTDGLCEWSAGSILAIAIPVTLVILAVCVGLGMFLKKKKEMQEKEAVEANPDYGYDDPEYEYKETKIVDNNDYYYD
eukprot:GFUD01014345.1.p1 GENE.GFUD01014345.1~~GFUD01014345.1.p1  ORF type:complete len:181 (+),score=43.12 GFUD01014345.1:48-590(+)